MTYKKSPCICCFRVPDPANCDNKNCALWRKWFLESWDAIHNYPRQSMEQAKEIPIGVPLGGRHYAHPHRVQAYRNRKPCEGCYAKCACSSPCKILINWTREGGKL